MDDILTALPVAWYLSMGGIIGLTQLIVGLSKGQIGNIKYLKEVPTIVYVVAVAELLTWVAHSLLGTLPGTYPELFMQAFGAAMAAAGIREAALAKFYPISSTGAAADVRAERAHLP